LRTVVSEVSLYENAVECHVELENLPELGVGCRKGI